MIVRHRAIVASVASLAGVAHRFDDLSVEDLRLRRSAKWSRFPEPVLPAWVAEMDYPLAEPITAALTELVARGDAGYASVGGLAEAFAGFCQRRYDVAPDPAGIVPVTDVMHGVRAALGLVTAPGDGVVICPPVYPPFFSTVAWAGRRVVEVPLAHDRAQRRYDLDFDALVDAFAAGAKAMLLCHPHNPVGRAWTRDELETLADLADRHHVVVLSDEIHGPLVYPDASTRHVPFASLDSDSARRSLTLSSASKAFNLPGLKCAVLVAGSPEVSARLATLPDEVAYGVSNFGVAASIAALTDADSWLDDTLAYLHATRELLARLLAEHLPQVRWRVPDATYLAWLDCSALRTGLGLGDPGEFFQTKAQVALSPGALFGTGGEAFVRLNFATSHAILTEIVERMGAAASAALPEHAAG